MYITIEFARLLRTRCLNKDLPGICSPGDHLYPVEEHFPPVAPTKGNVDDLALCGQIFNTSLIAAAILLPLTKSSFGLPVSAPL
jgi:hypothetical protein